MKGTKLQQGWKPEHRPIISTGDVRSRCMRLSGRQYACSDMSGNASMFGMTDQKHRHHTCHGSAECKVQVSCSINSTKEFSAMASKGLVRLEADVVGSSGYAPFRLGAGDHPRSCRTDCMHMHLHLLGPAFVFSNSDNDDPTGIPPEG